MGGSLHLGRGAVASTVMATVAVSLTEMPEVRALRDAAAVLLSTLGERGTLASHDREPAILARAVDGLDAALARLAARDEAGGG